jgi:hypothetical protein
LKKEPAGHGRHELLTNFDPEGHVERGQDDSDTIVNGQWFQELKTYLESDRWRTTVLKHKMKRQAG